MLLLLAVIVLALSMMAWRWLRRDAQGKSARRVLGSACLAGALLGGVSLAWCLLPTHWVHKTPRFVLRAMLNRDAAKREGRVDLPHDIQHAPSLLYSAKDPWERLRVQHAISREISAWAAAVTANQGPVEAAEWPRLTGPAERVHLLYQSTGGLIHGEGWVVFEVKEEISRRRARSDNPASLALRLEWVLAELQYLGAGYSHRPDWAMMPDAVIMETLSHSDERVRLFGLERLGRRVHLRVMDATMPMPTSFALAERLSESDPSEAVRRRAKDLLEYAAAFRAAG
ncbi:MAG: hypothetical protein KF859_03165 [Phycisphaeraceae bacterium]|nr:hypothetical protein [Phycisphaeraceae bacterium]